MSDEDAVIEDATPIRQMSRSPVKLDKNVLARARDLYAVYCAFGEGKSWDGRPCPRWDKLGDKVQRNWYGVALRTIQLTTTDADLEQLGAEAGILPSELVFGSAEDDTRLRQMIQTWTEYSR